MCDDKEAYGMHADTGSSTVSARLRAGALAVVLAGIVLAAAAALPGAAPVAAAPAGVFAPPWQTAAPNPAAFDLRARGKVTPVRSQENYSTCWVQSAVASLESCLLPKALLDLSENNLANHMSSRLVYEGHGDNRLATAYFARWDGPVLERDDPYPGKGRSPEGLRPVRHVQEVLYLPDRTGPLDNDALKWAVRTYGGVSTAMAFNATFFDSSTNGYDSTTAGMFLGHYVTCVGWDDSFPAARFNHRPPGPGAFLIRNSWGKDWGDAGYFWISYYDANYGHDMAVFDGAEPASGYDAIYQHDALGWSAGYGFGGESGWFAARYRGAGDGSVAAVSFYTPVPGSSYEVRVAGSVSAVAAAPVAASGVLAVGGYHTVRLDAAAPVRRGRAFVVAVRLTTPGSTRPVPLESPSDLIAPRAARGQSYVSADGKAGSDLVTLPGLASSDVCLKAFEVAAKGGDIRAPVASISGASQSPGGTFTVHYRVTDPAFSSASVTLTLSLVGAGGGQAWSTRVPALAPGSAGVLSYALDLPAGSYSLQARAYDVAGHGQASPARATLRVRQSAATPSHH
jgi:C1A family cysteine protease